MTPEIAETVAEYVSVGFSLILIAVVIWGYRAYKKAEKEEALLDKAFLGRVILDKEWSKVLEALTSANDDMDELKRRTLEASAAMRLSSALETYSVASGRVQGTEDINMKGEVGMNDMNNLLGKLKPGMCRLSMNGGIAVKTSSGYKTYNQQKGRLTNCDSFVFNVGEEFFFVIPTNKAEVGDILLINNLPKCVIKAEKEQLTVINYENSTIETVLPERHMFMGNVYFYGKIVSMFGGNFLKGKKGPNKIMQYMLMSEMFKGTSSGNVDGGMNPMMMYMMMNGGGNPFAEMFDFDTDEDEDSAIEEDVNLKEGE